MKLFENRVGRPSNETLKKRKLFYCLVFLSIFIIVITGGILFQKLVGKSLNASATNAKCKINRNDSVFDWVCESGYVKSVFVYNDNTKDDKVNSSILSKAFSSNKGVIAKYSNLTYSKSNRITISNLYDGYRIVFNLSDGKTEEISNFNGKTGKKKTTIKQSSSPIVYYTWNSNVKGTGTIYYYSYGTKATSYRIYLLDEKEKVKKSYKKVNIKNLNSHMGNFDVSGLEDGKLYKVELTFKKGARTYKESKIITATGPKYITVKTEFTNTVNKKVCVSNKKFKVKYSAMFNVLTKNNCEITDTSYYVVKPDITNINEELVYNPKTKLWYSGEIAGDGNFTNKYLKVSDINPGIDLIFVKDNVG